MCTLLFAWQVDPARPLIVAANRDEFRGRTAAPAHAWEDAPAVFAGRDLVGGGSWLGVTRSGRFAALTNVREPAMAIAADAPSRGGLVAGYLNGHGSPGDYLAGLRAGAYAGFNLVLADRDELWYLTNRSGGPRRLAPGVYGVSNAELDTPWPKVVRGRGRLAALVAAGAATSDALLELLADRAQANDDELPDTGVGLAMERVLSPICITGAEYGTRCSTALIMHRDGTVEFRERTWDPGARGEVAVSLSPAPA